MIRARMAGRFLLAIVTGAAVLFATTGTASAAPDPQLAGVTALLRYRIG